MDETKPQSPNDEVAAATQEERINAAFANQLLNARPDDLITIDPNTPTPNTNALPSNCLIEGPGRVELLAIAHGRLVESAGLNVKYVDRVHAYILKGTKTVIIQPAPDNDTTAYAVKRYDASASAFINLTKLLRAHKLHVPTGWKERYAVVMIPQGSPLGQGIAINLGATLERSRVNRKSASS